MKHVKNKLQKYLIGQSKNNARCRDISKNKTKIHKDTIFKFLSSPIFCLQYMMSSDLIFSMDIQISFKQKNVFLFVPASRAVPILQESPLTLQPSTCLPHINTHPLPEE